MGILSEEGATALSKDAIGEVLSLREEAITLGQPSHNEISRVRHANHKCSSKELQTFH